MVSLRRCCLQLLGAMLAVTGGCHRRPIPTSTDDGAPLAIVADAGLTAADAAPDRALPSCDFVALGSPVTLNDETVDARSPSLACSGAEFGAVWLRSSTEDHPAVYLRLASLGGGVLGNETLFGPESHSWAELAAKEQEYALCWHADPGMKGRVSFRRVNRQGAPLGDPIDLSTTDYTSTCHALVPTLSGWAAVLRGYLPEGRSVPSSYRYGLFLLGPTGAPLSVEEFVQVPVGGQTATSLVRLPKGYAVAYWQGPKGGSTSLAVQLFGLDGRLTGAARTLSPASGEGFSAPHLVWTGTNLLLFYLRISLNTESEVRELFLQRLSLAGQPVGPPGQLADPTAVVTSLDATWTGADVAVAWIAKGPSVALARLDAAGTRLQSDLELFRAPSGTNNVNAARVVVAGTPSRIGVAWEQQEGGGQGQIRLAVAGCPMKK